jgi:DNA-binding NarL/FixJ family response regulator
MVLRAEQSARLARLLRSCPSKRIIVGLVAEGLTNPEIAVRVGRSVDNVHTLLQQAFDAVGVHNRTKLAVLYAGLEPTLQTLDS